MLMAQFYTLSEVQSLKIGTAKIFFVRETFDGFIVAVHFWTFIPLQGKIKVEFIALKSWQLFPSWIHVKFISRGEKSSKYSRLCPRIEKFNYKYSETDMKAGRCGKKETKRCTERKRGGKADGNNNNNKIIFDLFNLAKKCKI